MRYYFIVFFLVMAGCKSTVTKDDFIGTYKVSKTVPLNNDSVIKSFIDQSSGWTLSLEDKDNFEFKGSGKTVVGYWTLEKGVEKEYRLMLNSSGYKVYAGFDGTNIYFDQPTGMLDSIFAKAIFVRVGK
jgi:hypothetical protein